MNGEVKFEGSEPEQWPLLPDEVIDAYGERVRVDGAIWYLNTPDHNAYVKWDFAVEWVSDRLLIAFKAWIVDSIEKRDPDTVTNRFRGLLFCFKKMEQRPVDIKHLNERSVLRLRNSLQRVNQSHLHQLVYLRLFYYWLVENRISGAEAHVAEMIRQVTIPDPTVGEAILTRHPAMGPLNQEEMDAIEAAIKMRLPADFETMVVMLFYELGLNPVAVSLLEERDFHVIPGPDRPYYQLDVVRIKKRNTKRVTVRRPLSDELGRAIEAHLARNDQRFGGRLPRRPLISRTEPRSTIRIVGPRRFDFHVTPAFLTSILREYPHEHGLISPRTGEALNLTARRFRYSYGTRLAELGTPVNELAALLDHSNRQSVLVYYKPSPKAAKRLDEAIGRSAGRVWAWFKGQPPVDKPADETNVAIMPAQTPTLKPLGGIGACGANLLCNLNPPYSCYVCPKFQPWRDAPHRALLEDVRAEQKRLREASGNNPAYPIPAALDQIERAMSDLVTALEKESNGH